MVTPIDEEPARLGGRYRLEERLGTGATADVHAAHDEKLDRPVAVKILRPEADDALRQRFADEARRVASLSHPHVVSVYDTGEHDGRPYLVMERHSGRTLADRMSDGPLPEDEAVSLAAQVLGALAAVEAAGLVHRDVKPANILLAADGSARLADFGIAKAGGGSDDTATGLTLGTPAYLAPERIEGQAASPASDVYSVGVILYEAITGARAFGAGTPAEIAAAAATRGVPPVPAELAGPATIAAVARATAIRPEDRFPSAAAFSLALASAAGDPTAAPVVAGADETTVIATHADVEAAPAVAGIAGAAPAALSAWWASAAQRMGVDGRRLAVIAASGVATLVLLLASWSWAGSRGDSSQPTAPTVPAVQATTPPPTAAPPPPEEQEHDEDRGKRKGRKGDDD